MHNFNSIISNLTPDIQNVLSINEELKQQFADVLRRQLEPLYGSQDVALDKIFNLKDRTAKVILDETTNNIAGILVYKNDLVDEYGIYDAVEIKTLMLINPEINGKKGLGALLINEVDRVALQKQASSIFVTVAKDKPESQLFFTKHGFVAFTVLENAYRNGNSETVFVKEVKYDDSV